MEEEIETCKMSKEEIEEEIKNRMLRINEVDKYKIQNKGYEWLKPWYNPYTYVMWGRSLAELLLDNDFPIFGEFEIMEIGDDYVRIKVPGLGNYEIMAFADNIDNEEIEIEMRIVNLSF
jgi:hypothetical protein